MTTSWVTVLAVANTVILLFLLLAVIFLYRQWGAIVLRGSEGINSHHGLRLGLEAPPISGIDAGDGLPKQIRPRKEVVTFATAGCEICEEKGYLFRDLAVVQDRWAVTYLHAGSAREELPEQIREYNAAERLRVLFDPNRETHDSYEVQVSPFVMVIDGAGRIAAKGLVSDLSQLVQLLIDAGDDALGTLRDDLREGRLIVDRDSESGSLISRHVERVL